MTGWLNTLTMDPCRAYDAIAGMPLGSHLAVRASSDAYTLCVIVCPDLYLLSLNHVELHAVGRTWQIPAKTAPTAPTQGCWSPNH